jgi:hypothetical protein
MKNVYMFGVTFAAAALLTIAVTPLRPANADMVTGELSLSGGNNYDLTAQTITFSFGNPFNVATETGIFLELGTGGHVTWRNQGVPINFNTLTAGSDLLCGAGCMFTGVDGGNDVHVSFNLTEENVPQIVGNVLALSGTGIIQMSNPVEFFDPTPGIFSLTTQGGSGVNRSFSATITAVPGPVVGAGLPGLILACGALLVLARRRRELVA